MKCDWRRKIDVVIFRADLAGNCDNANKWSEAPPVRKKADSLLLERMTSGILRSVHDKSVADGEVRSRPKVHIKGHGSKRGGSCRVGGRRRHGRKIVA